MIVWRPVPVTADGEVVTADGEVVYVLEPVDIPDASRTTVTKIKGLVRVPIPSYVAGLFQDVGPLREAAGTIVSGRNFVPTPAGTQMVRGGSRVVLTLHNGSSNEISHALLGEPFSPCGGLLIGWDDALNKHYAYRVTEDMAFYTGTEATSRTDLTAAPSTEWDNGSTPARPVMAELWEKMFLCDAIETYGSRNTLLSIAADGTVVQPAFQFGAGPAAALRPYCLEEYNGVLFIAGYGAEDDTDRPEYLRHSFLGRSPDDTTGGAEGFEINSWNIIGAIGQRITALRKGRGLLLVAKANELHRVSGFGRAYPGWQYQVEGVQNTLGLGVANPRALTFVSGGAGDMWFGVGAQGPFRTDGFTVESLVGPRQRGWRGIDRLEAAWVRYHPQRRVVLFGLHPTQNRTGRSASYPWTIWVWDLDRERWATDWDNDADYHYGFGLATTTGDGPTAAPSAPATSSQTTGGWTADWTNGDADADTELWLRDITAGGAFTLYDGAIAPGVATLAVTGQLPRHQFEWRVRHSLNGALSEFSAATSALTLLAAPTLASSGTP